MYVKMMGVNNDSGVVHCAITRCQVQSWYMLARCRACSVLVQSRVKLVITPQQRAQCVICYAKFLSVVNTHKLSDISTMLGMSHHIGTLLNGTCCFWKMDCRCLTQVEGGMIETRKKIFDKLWCRVHTQHVTGLLGVILTCVHTMFSACTHWHSWITELNSILLRWYVSAIKVTTNG